MKILLVHFYPEMKIGGYVSYINHFVNMMNTVAQVDVLTGSKLHRIQTKSEWLEAAEGYDILVLAYPGHTDEKYYRIMPDSLPWVVILHQPEKWTWARFLPGIKWQMEMCNIIFLRRRVRDYMLPNYEISKFYTVLNIPFNSQYIDPGSLLLMKSKDPPIVLFPSRFTGMKKIKLVFKAVSDIEAKVVFSSTFARVQRGRLRPDSIITLSLWSEIREAKKAGAIFLNGFEEKDKPTIFGKSTICLDTTRMPGSEGSLQYVTLEAMQYGAVPVMFRVWEDIMIAGKNFEPIDEPQDLVPAVNKLLKDPDRLKQYAFTNMEFINKHYSYQVLAPQYMAYFEEILKC